jgi:DnaJ-class molecular chaperone
MTKMIVCPECFGTKQEARMRAVIPGTKLRYRPCPRCNGTGEIEADAEKSDR